jgi:hypothetical protein
VKITTNKTRMEDFEPATTKDTCYFSLDASGFYVD